MAEKMTDYRNELLNNFERRVYELLGLCDRQRKKIEELRELVAAKDKEIQEAHKLAGEWKAKYNDLLTARVIATDDISMRNAKKRLADLVKKVDRCIDLLKSE
ncbi:MAG: hypothetical protein LBD28_07975 [Tannerellaceae bacterium]|nr:hypothetical protein [Tannerellaceae bacterium]